MRSPRTDLGNNFTRIWLKLTIHLAAACRSPGAYMMVTWWRLWGKRVRARALLGSLVAASHRAYDLWLHSEGPPGETNNVNDNSISLVALVQAGSDPSQLNDTLRSLADEGIPSLVAAAQAPAIWAGIGEQIDWNARPWLMYLNAGDVLAPGAARAYRSVAARSLGRVVYADDDLLDHVGKRTAPHFKPNWNPELFHHFDYLTGACIIRADVQDMSYLNGPNWPQQLVLAATRERMPVHIPHVLHHRRSRPRPRVPAALEAVAGPMPPVTLIVPTRNGRDLLQTCLEGLQRTAYTDVEIIIVDNDSDDPATLSYLSGLDPTRQRVLRCPGPFNFSAINNQAVNQARGELLCLLNNDIEVIERDWLRTMAIQALRDDVGAVGAQLLYPDGRIQHAGVVLGIGGGAAHAHRLLHPSDEGYFQRHALPQFVSAVTAACLVVQRTKFLAVGGFDERNFAVAFNDVDLCLRLNRKGWQSLYEPRAQLIHHESVSRGFDRDAAGSRRLAGELAALKRLWNTGEAIDPFHHPQLSRFSEHFVVSI